jgi:hypothetical protein
MTTRTANCTLHLTEDDLSAWRSQVLPVEEQRRIGQHIPACAACQHTLADFAAIAEALRTEAVPPSGVPLWRATKATIATYERSRMHTSRKYIIAGGLGLLSVLILSFAVILASTLPAATSSSVGPPTSSTGPHATATPTTQVLQVSPSQGWVTASALAGGKAITFSIDHPLTGYACGNADLGANPPSTMPLKVWQTQNGGRTWSAPMLMPVDAPNCAIQVSPSNPNDIVVSVIQSLCQGGCDTNELLPSSWYRSLDGGQSWNAISAPDPHVLEEFIWAGPTLFEYFQGNPGWEGPVNIPHTLLASTNGNAFVPADNASYHAQLQGAPPHTLIGLAYYSLGSTLSIVCETGATPAYIVLQSSDGGVTWTHFTAATEYGTTYIAAITSADGSNLYAIAYDATTNQDELMETTDGAHTWQVRAALPGIPEINARKQQQYAFAPDGTVIVSIQTLTNTIPGVRPYELAPGATTWQPLAPKETTYNHLFGAISWGTDGHPVAVWAMTLTPSSTTPGTNGAYGIAYHAATP